jgi:phosphoglycerol transferase MdoB-like AlkP superfamily enzyme
VIGIGYFFLQKVVLGKNYTTLKSLHAITLSLICSLLLVLPMRGGLGIAPLNPGAVYFSNQIFANQSAINVVWNFMYSAVHQKVKSNPFIYMDDNKANEVVNRMLTSDVDTTGSWIKIKNPNVVIVIWESFTSKVVDSFYKGIEVTPYFNHLKKNGVFFSQAYASGDRTEKGIAAVLSGYPAQPITSIVKETQKAARLPILSKSFAAMGYHTSFFYGGDLEFANMKAYLYAGAFEKLISKNDFEASQSNTKWGAHDHFLFDKYLREKDKKTTYPFFDVIMTLSSHEPFETPIPTVIKGEDEESKFLNSLNYTDSSLGKFIAQISTKHWWDSTLVIIVADHGHRLPATQNRIDDFHIPILWTGGAIDTNIVFDVPTSQTDISKILLSQLKMDANDYLWNKNFDAQRGWAYFAFNNGFGYVDKECKVLFDNPSKQAISSQGNCSSGISNGKAYLQKSFEHYLNLDKQ